MFAKLTTSPFSSKQVLSFVSSRENWNPLAGHGVFVRFAVKFDPIPTEFPSGPFDNCTGNTQQKPMASHNFTSGIVRQGMRNSFNILVMSKNLDYLGSLRDLP